MRTPARDRRTLRRAGRNLLEIERGLRALYGPALAAVAAKPELDAKAERWVRAVIDDQADFDVKERAQEDRLRRAKAFEKAAHDRVNAELADLEKRAREIGLRSTLQKRLKDLQQEIERLKSQHVSDLADERRTYARSLELLSVPRGTVAKL